MPIIIAEIFLSAFLQVLFEKLASSGINVFLKRKKRSHYKTIKGWQEKLRLIEAVIIDAEQKQFHSNSVKFWLQDLQDLAYDLEDILDEFSTEARLINNLDDDYEYHIGCSPFNKVPSFLKCTPGASYTKSTAKYSNGIEQINNRLQDILTQAGSLGLSQQAHSRSERPSTSSLVCEPVVYGRDDEKYEILQGLLEDKLCHENYMVIPVVGKGGIGKTTLAQSVYNDEKVKSHFDVKAWVCVSDVFDVKHITTAIINSATHSMQNFSDLNEAHERLKNLLAGKRFLIVLDDIWSDKYYPWDQLQAPFHAATKGSRVIVTTRIERVAKHMLKTPAQSPIVHLKGLSDEHCWLLFQQHALVDPDVIDVRNEVVRLFKGLPLAAKALGGLLRKEDKSKWPKIFRSNIWSEEGGVLPALRLSYHHLPQHLKRIFSYCSIFPKDFEFQENNTVLMWMAEGFLPEVEEERMEDTGRDYFLDLVSRSLFEPCTFRKGYFIMHDLIHDLAQWAAGDVCCIVDIHKVSCRTRYFSFTKEVLEGQLWSVEKLDQLRTFAFFGRAHDVPLMKMLDSIFQQFQYLRSLSMANMGITELPNCIGDLKHLRLLDLSFNWKLKELPESTSKLCNLQTLILKNCQCLRKVVTNMALLNELRHLDINGTALLEMPLGIGKLSKLQALTKFWLTAEHGPRISELKNLKCLHGSLEITNLQNVVRSEDAKEARLHEKLGLDVIKMSWSSSSNEADHNIERHVLEQLQPQKYIKELELNGYKALAFPAWLGNPSFTKMVVIKLKGCSGCDCLPTLGHLPSLKELSVERIDGIRTVGPELYGAGSNPFPALKILRFDYMKNWEELLHLSPSVDNTTAFSCLEELIISWCPLLRGNLPSGLSFLKKLVVRFCNELRVLLPRCPLRDLDITRCKELSSTAPVICCSERLILTNIFQFSGIEGFWVQGVQALVAVDVAYLAIGSDCQNRLKLVNCPKLQTWKPDVYGDLNNLTHVACGNCEQLAVFLENKFPACVRHLTLHGDDCVEHISRLTSRSTCLEELNIEYCSSLITVSNLPLTLQTLVIKDSNIKQPVKEWGLPLLTSLKELVIVNAGSSVNSVESIPDLDLYLPPSLCDLTIKGFQNLKTMSCSSLPNLTKLWIQNCALMKEECIQPPNGFIIMSG